MFLVNAPLIYFLSGTMQTPLKRNLRRDLVV